MLRRYNIGILVSGMLHLCILLIPVSMDVTQKFNSEEIELFVMDEAEPVVQESRKVIKIAKKQKLPVEEPEEIRVPDKVEEKYLKEEKIEPKIVSETKEAISLPPTIKVPVQQKTEFAGTEIYKTIRQPSSVDVEFGTWNAPSFLHREMPVYPIMARKLGKEGKVVLRLIIDEKGNLINIEVIENAGYGFKEAAVEAVRKSTFLPAKKNGKHIASRAILPVRFILRSQP